MMRAILLETSKGFMVRRLFDIEQRPVKGKSLHSEQVDGTLSDSGGGFAYKFPPHVIEPSYAGDWNFTTAPADVHAGQLG